MLRSESWILRNKSQILKNESKALRCDHHRVYTEERNKIALSSNDNKRIQTFDKGTFPYGTNILKVVKFHQKITGLCLVKILILVKLKILILVKMKILILVKLKILILVKLKILIC